MKYGTGKYLAILSWVTASCCLTACGGDSGKTTAAPALTTGVAGDKQLSELSDTELEKLNNAVATYTEKEVAASLSRETLCEFGGAYGAILALALTSSSTPTDKELQSACSALATKCMESDESEEQSPESGSVERAALTNCTATVAEYEACVEDGATAWLKVMASLPTCSELTAASLSDNSGVAQQGATPASCKTLEEKCPSAVSDSESSNETFEDDTSEAFEDDASE